MTQGLTITLDTSTEIFLGQESLISKKIFNFCQTKLEVIANYTEFVVSSFLKEDQINLNWKTYSNNKDDIINWYRDSKNYIFSTDLIPNHDIEIMSYKLKSSPSFPGIFGICKSTKKVGFVKCSYSKK